MPFWSFFLPSRIGCWSCTPRPQGTSLEIPLGSTRAMMGHGLGPTKRKSCWNVRCSGIWRHAVKAWTEFAWFSRCQKVKHVTKCWCFWWLTKPTSFTFCQNGHDPTWRHSVDIPMKYLTYHSISIGGIPISIGRISHEVSHSKRQFQMTTYPWLKWISTHKPSTTWFSMVFPLFPMFFINWW